MSDRNMGVIFVGRLQARNIYVFISSDMLIISDYPLSDPIQDADEIIRDWLFSERYVRCLNSIRGLDRVMRPVDDKVYGVATHVSLTRVLGGSGKGSCTQGGIIHRRIVCY